MTEYELAELTIAKQALFWQVAEVAQGSVAQMTEMLERFMTILFGYLVVAYFVGDKLTKIQVGLLTGLYLFWLGRLTFAANAAWRSVDDIFAEMKIINPDLPPPETSTLPMYILLLAVTVASLYFMWSVRHPKVE